jgi:hypothetical protein
MFRSAIFPPGGEILLEIFSGLSGIWHGSEAVEQE